MILLGSRMDSPVIHLLSGAPIPIKPNSAVCFLLLSVSLLFLAPRSATLPRKVIGRACAVLALIIAAFTLAEYLLGISPGIDRLLIPEIDAPVGAPVPGRMAVGTAIGCALLAVSLLGLEWKIGKVSLSEAVCVPAAGIGLIGILGHLYQTIAFETLGPFNAMSIPSTLLLVVGGIAIILSRTDRGLAALLTGSSAGAATARRLLPFVILLPAVLGWLRLLGQQAGYFDVALGLSLVIVLMILVLTAAVVWSAKVIDRKEQAVLEFCANISHELRTPLSGIIGMNELLLRSELSGYQKECAQAVQTCAKGLLSLVNDILDISKIEAGQMTIDRVPFSPVNLAASALAVLDSSARSKNLRLVVEHDLDASTALMGDPLRLQQVLLNLLGNAVKYTEKGEVRLTVNLESQEGDYCLLKYSVIDTGIGISDEEQKLLFVPFSQLDSSMTRRYGGTGLGLAISKRVVQLMGGEIGCRSAKDHGSTFWFTIPLQRAESPIQEAPPAKRIKISPDLRRTILVIEDNPLLQSLVEKQLKRLGFVPETVRTAEEGLKCLEEHSYSLILMDCHLPKMDGYEATRRIRAGQATRDAHIPIIAMTAGAMRTDQDACKAAGMDDYISKPYTADQLQAIISRWLPDDQSAE